MPTVNLPSCWTQSLFLRGCYGGSINKFGYWVSVQRQFGSRAPSWALPCCRKPLDVHRRIPHASLTLLTACPNLRALLTASRVGGQRDLPEGGVLNSHLLNPNEPILERHLLVNIPYSERQVGSLGLVSNPYHVLATGKLQFTYELPFNFHPGFIPFRSSPSSCFLGCIKIVLEFHGTLG